MSSICMTARDDNDEGLSSITISATFDKVSKRMPLYEYVYVGAVHKSSSVKLYILHEGTYIRVSTISVPTVLQVAF